MFNIGAVVVYSCFNIDPSERRMNVRSVHFQIKKKKKFIYRIICIFYQFWNYYYYYFLKDIYFRIMIRFWCSFLEDYCHFTSLQVHLVHLLSFDFLWVCLELECSPSPFCNWVWIFDWMDGYLFPYALGAVQELRFRYLCRWNAVFHALLLQPQQQVQIIIWSLKWRKAIFHPLWFSISLLYQQNCQVFTLLQFAIHWGLDAHSFDLSYLYR